MKRHSVKCWPEYYQPLIDGFKTADLRINDRAYQVDDELLQQEFDPTTQTYTGRESLWRITHIVHGAPWLHSNMVMLSLASWRKEDAS